MNGVFWVGGRARVPHLIHIDIYIYIYRTLRWQGVSASPNIYINIYINIYRTLRWQGVSASPNIYIYIYLYDSIPILSSKFELGQYDLSIS